MRRQYEAAGITTLICRFAFGDLSLEESLASVALFADQVMPALADVGAGVGAGVGAAPRPFHSLNKTLTNVP
jgi:hypothetical protein